MELRHLRYFAAVAEAGSFSVAAEGLFIAQPALSKQIRQLEEELGVLLFARHARGVVLTPAGKALLPEARVQLASMGRLADLARRARGVEKHRLRVGIAPSLAIPVLPGLAARLQAHFSEFDMDVRDIASTEQTEALLANEIDIGMACLRPRHSAVSVACHLEDRLCIAMHQQDPRARQESLSLQQFVEDRFAAFSEQSWLTRGDRPDPIFAKARFQPYVHYEVATVHRVLDLVAAGLGVALLPSVLALHRPKEVALRPLRNVPRCTALALLRRRADSNPVLAFVDPAMRETFARLQQAAADALDGATLQRCP
ncbi:LysR family transcriptional regulator [Eleftheria terrae]|uniref:LysR family transcriptional regulator n=1 Tax=Eleftheria terrae TaxID=1597781 RepID=UPI00263B1CF2|nr:LysR substrate-binding domain-containing protein [Eleftheria terrae]WKB50898.1 LysR substrate-binding domain-containing protein [Eleftheria terrae]